MRTLYIEQKLFKITDHYPITDENEEPVYRVDEDFQFFGKTVHVSDYAGRQLFTVQRELWTLLPKFKIIFADGRELTLQSRMSLFRKHIQVLPENLGITIEGDYFSKSFEVLRHGNLIGKIDRKLFSFADKFAIEVIDQTDEELFIAIMIAVDTIIDAQQNS